MSHNRSLAEKRKHIIETLIYFGVPTDKIIRKLDKAKNISIPEYLDEALIPLISNLYENKAATLIIGNRGWGNEEDLRFRSLITLCFRGDLSQKAWDAVWKQLKEDEQIFYTTTDTSLGLSPLAVAAHYGNLAALKRLEDTYQSVLPKYPDRRPRMHQQLRQALLEVAKNIKSQQQAECFTALLQ